MRYRLVRVWAKEHSWAVRLLMPLSLLPLAFSVLVWAALSFDPASQPTLTAPPYATSEGGVAAGTTKVFRAYYDDSLWWGDLLSYDLTSAGKFEGGSDALPNWSAMAQLEAMAASDRLIMTLSDGAAVLFDELNALSASQRAALLLNPDDFATDAERVAEQQDVLDFLRGDDTYVGGKYRNRLTSLGDIVHSTPTYVEYSEDTLSENRIYVGANDGMLHAFNAATGDEMFTYIPGTVFNKLALLTSPDYVSNGHQYYVDGPITVADAIFSLSDKKVLVSALGAGGKGIFALDITSNVASTDTVTDKLLWELDNTSTGMANLGYTYGRALIVQVNNGVSAGGEPQSIWAAIFPNGYGSASGTASLFVVNLQTGALIREINTNSAVVNGLSSPAAADVNNDGIVDYVYAGDLNGQLWRFDLTDASNGNWQVAFSGSPFFSTDADLDLTDNPKAITTPPRLLRHPDGGLLVLVGTGIAHDTRYITDDPDADINYGEYSYSLYGLHDTFDGVAPDLDGDGHISLQTLTETNYTQNPGEEGERTLRVRVASDNTPGKYGWELRMPATGEMMITPLQIRGGRVLFSSHNPVLETPEVWTNEVNYLTGGAPSMIIYDLSSDGMAAYDDNAPLPDEDFTCVEADGATSCEDKPSERVVSLYQEGATRSSKPTLATTTATSGVFLINHVEQAITTEPIDDSNILGLYGGHFDVDSTSYIARPNGAYPLVDPDDSNATSALRDAIKGSFDSPVLDDSGTEILGPYAGAVFDYDQPPAANFYQPAEGGGSTEMTDAHVHEYDDKYDVVGIDAFGFSAQCGDPGKGCPHEISYDVPLPLGPICGDKDKDCAVPTPDDPTDQYFKLMVVNAHRSPGGRLAINNGYNESDTSSYIPVIYYDDSARFGDLAETVYNLTEDGAALYPGQVEHLTELGIYFDTMAIVNGGLVPTQTPCVKKNLFSGQNEWRNGALTLWAVEVVPTVQLSGDVTFEEAYTVSRNTYVPETSEAYGSVNGIAPLANDSRGLLWEVTLFWHWKGSCTHEYYDLTLDAWKLGVIDTYQDKDNTGQIPDGVLDSLPTFSYEQLYQNAFPASDGDGSSGDGSGVSGSGSESSGSDSDTHLRTSPIGNLSNPNRASWRFIN